MSDDTIDRFVTYAYVCQRQRCNGCGHQWDGAASVTLCGDCWRKSWPFVFGGVNPEAFRPCPHGDPACPCQDGDPCHYEATATTPAMAPPIISALRRIRDVLGDLSVPLDQRVDAAYKLAEFFAKAEGGPR